MMNNDQLFDELVRLKAQQRHFDSVDAGWEKMEKLLPPQSSRRGSGLRIAVLLFLFSALAIGGLMSFLQQEAVALNRNARTCSVLSFTAQKNSAGTTPLSFTTPRMNDYRDAYSAADQTKVHVRNHTSVLNKNTQQISGARREEQTPLSVAESTATENEATAFTLQTPATVSSGKESGNTTTSPFTIDALTPSLALLSAPEKTGSVAQPVQWLPDANYWLVQGGVSYTASMTGNRDHASFNPVVGIGYNVWLNPSWSVQAGVRYTSIGNVSDIRYSSFSASSPGVAEYSESRLQRFHAVALPLQVWRRTSYRHAFSAGYTLNFMIGAQQQNYSRTETNGIISHEQTNNSFTHSGFTRFDGLFTAGYSYTFSGRLQAEVSAYTGVTDILHNSTYGNRFERNRGVQLLVNYSF